MKARDHHPDHHDPVTPRWLVRAGWTGWRRELGWTLIGLSILVSCVAGASYSGASMPFPDPTPEMIAQQAKDMHEAEVRLWVAGAAGSSGLLAGVWLIVRGRRLRGRSRASGAGTEQHP